MVKSEAVKKIIAVIDQLDVKDRYHTLLMVAGIYDPDPDGDGGEEKPVPLKVLNTRVG